MWEKNWDLYNQSLLHKNILQGFIGAISEHRPFVFNSHHRYCEYTYFIRLSKEDGTAGGDHFVHIQGINGYSHRNLVSRGDVWSSFYMCGSNVNVILNIARLPKCRAYCCAQLKQTCSNGRNIGRNWPVLVYSRSITKSLFESVCTLLP